MKLTEALEKFIIKLNVRKHSKATQSNASFHIKAFIEWVGKEYRLDDSRPLRKYMLERYQNFLVLEHDYENSYINQRIIAVNSFMRYLKKEAEVTSSCEGVLERVKEGEKLPEVITVEQYDAIRESIDTSTAIGKRDYAITTLFLSSGIRVGGLHLLNVEDFNLAENSVKVLGKANREYLAVYGDQCKEVLAQYLECTRGLFKGANDTRALFLSRKHNRLSIRAIQALVKKHGLNADGIYLSPHTFRRTFCTELLCAEGGGANLYHVARMMGHSSLEHLKRYARMNIEPLRETHKRCHPRG